MEDYTGKKITIMGLGLNGGGMAAAKFFASKGAKITVTDLRSAAVLKPSMDMLSEYDIRYVLEKHEISDFENADIVIKNPAVPLTSPYLAKAKRIETDISIFLSEFKGDVIAVTGSKGKSTTVSAIYHGMKKLKADTFLGGNITISPLSFLEELTNKSLVILELSSWQLADIRGKGLLKPVVSSRDIHAEVTDWFIRSLHEKGQLQQITTKQFFDETPAHPIWFSGSDMGKDEQIWLSGKMGYIKLNGKTEQILPEKLLIPGDHNRKNMLIAAATMYLYGFKATDIMDALADFKGIPHRLHTPGMPCRSKELRGACSAYCGRYRQEPALRPAARNRQGS